MCSSHLSEPAGRITLDEPVSMALLVVLESMTPAERVAFILHDVFGYLTGDHVTRIWAIRNPGKLRPWTTG
jgi:hypothetical protein